MTYASVDDVRRANDRAGSHWFEPDTLRFFRSRVGERLYGGRYFVTSEQPPDGRRAYTVRCAMPDGSVETVGPFCVLSSSAAHRLAQRCAEAVPVVEHDPYPDQEGNEPNPRRYEWSVKVAGERVGSRLTLWHARRLRGTLSRKEG